MSSNYTVLQPTQWRWKGNWASTNSGFIHAVSCKHVFSFLSSLCDFRADQTTFTRCTCIAQQRTSAPAVHPVNVFPSADDSCAVKQVRLTSTAPAPSSSWSGELVKDERSTRQVDVAEFQAQPAETASHNCKACLAICRVRVTPPLEPD
jgi:hypothetical protein